MNLHQIQFEETSRFSSIFLDYINNKEELREFYSLAPDIDSFSDAIANRSFDDRKRKVLVDVLTKQYKNCPSDISVSKNIESINQPKTFTITTGHQLNIFTGPLFFIYKIAAVINMAKQLNEKYPDNKFVPVYWMASEDHDFEEINNFKLFGKKYTWESDQKGPVGRFKTSSMKGLLEEIPEKPAFCDDGYLKQNNLSDATRHIVNELFGKHGLVILDADEAELKKEFIPIISDELFNQKAHALVQSSTEKLESMGYKSQIFPRPINLFYMKDGLRQRIVYVDGKFSVLNTDINFSEEEMKSMVDNHPDRFSPNVVLRPVYQEVILPNLAYVGGPAEVAYWLQLKSVFDQCEVPFPIIFPRLFAMNIAKAIVKKIDKLGLSNNDLFKNYDTLKEQLLYSNAEPAYELATQLNDIAKVFESIQQKAMALDKSLEGFVMGEFKKTEKGVINIQKRLKKAEEQKEEVKLNQLKGILEKLFPGGNPQEREDNFLNFYINNPKFVDELIEELDPFTLKYNILTEDV